MSNRRSANHQRAVAYSLADGFVLLSGLENGPGGDSGNSFPKGHMIWIHQAQRFATEILHGAGGSADVERIARRYQDDDEVQSNKSGCSRVIRAHTGGN